MTEKSLIRHCKAGDSKAIRKLYEMYAAKMLGVCFRYAGNRDVAQDMLHDGFVTVISKIGEFRGDGSFEGWIRKVFVTTALQHIRRNARFNLSEDIECASDISYDAGCDALEQISLKELTNCIKSLPEGYRTVLNLFAVEGYSHKEIAVMLGISEGTSRSQYSRAKAQLMELITKMNNTIPVRRDSRDNR